ncbi:MAG: diguanylate cyclase [Actinomycetota bacterium]|nr:diguanylate cyclase [Actinomycetota bacterium]MDH5277461.1 diguanylate cyclase [Actinomycetota bacterium]
MAGSGWAWRRSRRGEATGPDVRAVAQRGSATTRLRKLADIARVAWSVEPEQLGFELAVAARQALDGASVSLCAWEPEHGRVRCLVNEGELGPGEVPRPRDEYYSLDDYAPLGMLLEAQVGWVADIDTGDGGDASVRLLRQLDKRSSLSVPIPGQGRIWGELYVTRGHDQAPFTDEDLDLGVAVGAQVGAALVTAEHLKRFEHQMQIDPQTGLAGRGSIDERLQLAVSSCAAEGTPAALVLVDVVGLRDLQVTDGRPAVDQVIRRTAALVSAAAGRVDAALAGRYDWDRFCVVVAGRPADEAVELAEWLVREVRRLLPVMVACGIAATDDLAGPAPSRERLVRLAEAAQSRARAAHGLVPVVAGRQLPALATVGASVRRRRHHAAADPESGGTSSAAEVPQLVDDTKRLLQLGLELMDESGPQVRHRLAALAAALCDHVDGLGWWVSAANDGGDAVETVDYAVVRRTATMVPAPGKPNWTEEPYPVAQYPATAEVMRGGWAVVDATDLRADPAELSILDGMGATALLMAGGRDETGRGWLVEVFADALSLPMDDVVAALRALVATALHPPEAPR